MADSLRSLLLYQQAVPLSPSGSGRTAEAIALFEEAIREDDRNMRAYVELARLFLFQMHDSQKAREYALAGLSIEKVPLELQDRQLGRVSAVATYREALDYILFRVALDGGDHDSARATLDVLRAHWIAYQRGSYQEAVKEMRAAENSRRRAGKSGGCAVLIAVGAGAVALHMLG